MTKTITPFAAWMKAATPEEQETLAQRIGSSRAMLYHYSNGNRDMSVERAAQVETETAAMAKFSKGRLPRVMRTDLVPTCRNCPYAQRCLGDRALASEFPIVTQ